MKPVLFEEGGQTKYGIKEFIIDNAEDVAALPTDIPLGSCALAASDGSLYFLVKKDGEEQPIWQQLQTN